MRRRYLVVLASLAVVASPILTAQQAPPAAATGLVLGRVIDAATGQPLSGAAVTIAPAPAAQGSGQPGAPPRARPGDITGPARVMTDAEGRFVFYGLPAGAFSITATRSGYMSGAFGQRIPSALPGAVPRPAPLLLAAGARRSDVTVALWKYGVISGRVVDEQGEPMIGVQVRVLRRTIVAGRVQLSQTGNMPATDDRGVYRIPTLQPGDYVAAVVTTQATMPASIFDSYAAAVRAGDNLDFTRELSAGGASIVRDGLRVGSFLVGAGSSAPGATLGSVRMPAVLPAAGGRLLVYPTVYYPAVSTPAEAAVIPVGPGEERGGIDFQLRPVPASSVSGSLTGPAGPVSHTALELLAEGTDLLSREDSYETATTITDAAGAFTFLGVPPGRYRLRTLRAPERPRTQSLGAATIIQTGSTTISSGIGGGPPLPIPDEPTWWASMPVTVGGSDVTGLAVTLRSGARIRGRVQFDGTAKPPADDQLERISVSIESADGRTSSGPIHTRTARVDADGRLTSYQLPPGAYILRAGAPPSGWTFASATLDGRDVSVAPLELADADVDVLIRFTDRPSVLSGTIAADATSSDEDVLVVVFPVDARRWTSYGRLPRQLQSSGRKGGDAFTFTGLPDGEYHVAALRQDADREWQDPALLKKLAPLAARVRIMEGQTASVTVKLVEVR